MTESKMNLGCMQFSQAKSGCASCQNQRSHPDSIVFADKIVAFSWFTSMCHLYQSASPAIFCNILTETLLSSKNFGLSNGLGNRVLLVNPMDLHDVSRGALCHVCAYGKLTKGQQNKKRLVLSSSC